MSLLIKKLLHELLNENIQQADKLYFNTGKLSLDDKKNILRITSGDNFTNIISNVYFVNKRIEHYSLADINSFYQQIKTYDKNLFPINGFNINNSFSETDINNLIYSFNQRTKILKLVESLPTIAKRNLRHEFRIERGNGELRSYRDNLEYFLAHYSMLSNRDEKMRKSIEQKMFKNGTTIEQLINFVEEKENLLGGANYTKNMINTIVKNSYGDINKIYENDKIVVLEVNSPEGIKEVGCNSLWCFTYGSGFDSAYRQWNNYSTNDIVYVIIDFNAKSDSPDFMHVLIKPLDNVGDYGDDTDDSPLFNMANEMDYNPIGTIKHLVGLDNAKKLFNFGVEPKKEITKEKPFVDPNQLSLFEQKQKIKKMLFEQLSNLNTLYHGGESVITRFNSDKIVGGFRGNHGWGIYFSDSIYKARDYGQVITTLNSSGLNILDTRNSVDEKFVLMVKELSNQQSDSMLSAFYNMISGKLKEELGNTIDDARKEISSIFKWDISKAWSEMIVKLGYDIMKNGYEYVIINFEKANQALIAPKTNDGKENTI